MANGLELPMKMVQERLGHSTLAMTADTYGHLFPTNDDGAELAKAEKFFLGVELTEAKMAKRKKSRTLPLTKLPGCWRKPSFPTRSPTS